MNKLPPAERTSANLIAANIAALQQLFPELVTEGKDGAVVNVDVLKELVGDRTVTDAEERFGLNWHGKRAARRLALTPSLGTLRPCPEESVDWETTQNLMIEGDNLEVLKLLQKSYAGKVKLIYIDPPYNTGKDFVYPDDYHEPLENYLKQTGQAGDDGQIVTTNTETSGRFHSKWLSMMYPRLRLARQLLKDDGILLVSIDEAEIANLTELCSELFGRENQIATMIWEKGRKNDAKLISVGHEYILIVAKLASRLKEKGTVWREEKPGAREIWDAYLRARAECGDDDRAVEAQLAGWFASLPANHPSRKWSRYRRVDSNGPWRDRDISWPGGGGPRYEVLHPITQLPCAIPERGWIYSSQEVMLQHIRAGLVEFRSDHTEPPFRKAHLRPISTEVDSEAEDEEDADTDELATQVRGSYFYKQSQVTVKHLRGLFGSKIVPIHPVQAADSAKS